jgi:hypothetical protein
MEEMVLACSIENAIDIFKQKGIVYKRIYCVSEKIN